MFSRFLPLVPWACVGVIVGVLINQYGGGALAARDWVIVLAVTASLTGLATERFLRGHRGNAPAVKASESVTETDRLAQVEPFLMGIVLVCVGQYLMTARGVRANTFGLSEWLNGLFRIDVPNLDAAIIATVLLLSGGYSFARSYASCPFFEPRLVEPRESLSMLVPSQRSRNLITILIGGWAFLFLLWRLSVADGNLALAIIWIAVLTWLGRLAYAGDRRTGIVLSPQLGLDDVCFIGAVAVMGIAIGAYDLTRMPSVLMGDEGSFWETAQSIAKGIYQPSLWGVGVYSYPILSSIYQALILKIFGISFWSWRFASVLAGVAAVVPTYFLARELFDRRVALLASAVMVVTPYFIAFARLGYNNSQALFPVVLTLYFLYAGLKRSSTLYLFLSGIAAGFGFYTYTAGRLGVVVAALFFAGLGIARLAKRLRYPAESSVSLRTLFILGLIFGVGFAITALPHMVYGWAINPESINYKTQESLFPSIDYALAYFTPEALYRDNPPIQLGNHTYFYRPDLYAQLLIRGVLRTALAFHHAEITTEHFIAGPLPGSAAVVFYFGGLAIALANLRRKNFGLLLLWFFSGACLLSALTTFPPRHQHLVPIIPVVSIFTALGIISVADVVATQVTASRRTATGLITLTCFGLIALVARSESFLR